MFAGRKGKGNDAIILLYQFLKVIKKVKETVVVKLLEQCMSCFLITNGIELFRRKYAALS